MGCIKCKKYGKHVSGLFGVQSRHIKLEHARRIKYEKYV